MNYVQNFEAEFCPLHSQFGKKTCSGLNAKVKLKLCAILRRDFFLEVWPEFEMVDNFKRESFGCDKSGEVQVLLFDKIKYRDQRKHLMSGTYDDKQRKCNKYGNESCVIKQYIVPNVENIALLGEGLSLKY